MVKKVHKINLKLLEYRILFAFIKLFEILMNFQECFDFFPTFFKKFLVYGFFNFKNCSFWPRVYLIEIKIITVFQVILFHDFENSQALIKLPRSFATKNGS